jgi:hypothetical protein
LCHRSSANAGKAFKPRSITVAQIGGNEKGARYNQSKTKL